MIVPRTQGAADILLLRHIHESYAVILLTEMPARNCWLALMVPLAFPVASTATFAASWALPLVAPALIPDIGACAISAAVVTAIAAVVIAMAAMVAVITIVVPTAAAVTGSIARTCLACRGVRPRLLKICELGKLLDLVVEPVARLRSAWLAHLRAQ